MRRSQLTAAAFAATAALFGRSPVATADITGFGGFAAVNAGGATSAVGYSADGGTFTVTDGNQGEAASGFVATPQNVAAGFRSTFTYTVPGGNGVNPQYDQADGFNLVLQNDPRGTAALGGGGGDKGYTGTSAITASAAIGVEIYGGSHVEAFTNGNSLGTSGTFAVNNGDPVQVTVGYAGSTLSIGFYDPTTHAVSYKGYTGVNLAMAVGGNTAYVGITGATGGAAATQRVSNFRFAAVPALTYAPLTLTAAGFNQDMVVEANAPLAGAAASITATVDAGTGKQGATFYEQGYDTADTNGTTGLPAANTTFVSQSDPTHSFRLASYTGNNALLLNSTSTSGTLALAAPARLSAVSFLTDTGNADNGAAPFSVVVNYANGAPSTTIPAELISPDWFNNGPVAYSASGRVYPDATAASGFDSVGNGQPNLYQVDLLLPDTTDPIASFTLTYDGTSTSSQMAVFGLSGASVAVPEPATFSVLAAGAAGLLTRRRRRA